MSDTWRIYGESTDGSHVDIHKDDHRHAIVLGLPKHKAEQIVAEHNAALGDVARLRAALTGMLESYDLLTGLRSPLPMLAKDVVRAAFVDEPERARNALRTNRNP